MHAPPLQRVVHAKPWGNFSACRGGSTGYWIFSHICARRCANLITRSRAKLGQMPQFRLTMLWGWNCSGSLHMLRLPTESTCLNPSNSPLTAKWPWPLLVTRIPQVMVWKFGFQVSTLVSNVLCPLRVCRTWSSFMRPLLSTQHFIWGENTAAIRSWFTVTTWTQSTCSCLCMLSWLTTPF